MTSVKIMETMTMLNHIVKRMMVWSRAVALRAWRGVCSIVVLLCRVNANEAAICLSIFFECFEFDDMAVILDDATCNHAIEC